MPPISFNELPYFSDLFCDYINGNPALKKFYNGSFKSQEDIAAHIEHLRNQTYQRNALTDILALQNKTFHAREQTFAHIEQLREPDTFAIVTGQQVGLFGGPLYTIYKIITALQLCESLAAQHPGSKFVPVFWLESEDHDLDEANHTYVLDHAGALLKLEYERERGTDGNPVLSGSVGSVIFDERIKAVLESIEKNLNQTEFHPDVMKLISQSYAVGNSFVRAFAMLLQGIFPEEGLILLDPMDKNIKKLLAPVFRCELETTPRVSEAVISQSALLEINYHAQVKARSINLFMLWKNGRFGIDPRHDHGDYWLKGTRQYFTRDELFQLLEEKPECFSPNVVLRPVCQDYLLPTVMYVGGPGEIAYFAQFKPVYDVFSVTMPIIYPRASVTIIEERFLRSIEKFSLTVNEILIDAQSAMKKAVQSKGEMNLDEILGTAHTLVTEAFESVRPAIETYDTTLLRALDTGKEKALQALDVLGNKITDAAMRVNKTTVGQMEKLTVSIVPNEKLQERSLNILYFLNKYGLGFAEMLMQVITLDTSTHEIVPMPVKVKSRSAEVQPTLFE